MSQLERQVWIDRGLCWICHQVQTEIGQRGTIRQAHARCRKLIERGWTVDRIQATQQRETE